MKKILALILILTIFFCVSCSAEPNNADESIDRQLTDNTVAEQSDENEESTAPDEITENTEETSYTCVFADGRQITLGEKADSFLASFGDYSDVMEAPSCIHEGFDRVYSFDGFTVTTSPDGSGFDYVVEVALTGWECVLENGIHVGSTMAGVEAVYGTEYEDLFGQIKYSLGSTEALFLIDGGVVANIAFTEAAE
mgnify:CR=1 FL=1